MSPNKKKIQSDKLNVHIDQNDDDEENSENRDELDICDLSTRIVKCEDASLHSTQRALRCLNDTYEVGVHTASELVKQGERLRDLDECLVEADEDLIETQQNINQIKSIFGGLKNKFSFSSRPLAPAQSTTTAKTTKSKRKADKKPKKEPPAPLAPVITNSEQEKQMNMNLEEMSVGLARLNMLAKDMHAEVNKQSPLIDRLGNRIDMTKTTIENQHSQIKKKPSRGEKKSDTKHIDRALLEQRSTTRSSRKSSLCGCFSGRSPDARQIRKKEQEFGL